MKLFLKILAGIFAFIGLTVLILWGLTAPASRPEPLAALTDDGLDATLAGVAAERKLVGIVARVMINGEIVAEAESGWRTKDEVDPIQLTDMVHVGSIGKSMSATTIARLVEDGVMSWEDTLGQHLMDIPMDAGWSDVTLSQLLTHTASAPRPPLSAMINSVSEPVRLAEVRRETAEIMLSEPPAHPPGTRYAYSNGGYMLASLMAEEATGESWESIVQTHLVEPLGLSSLGFGAPLGDNPWGHRRVGPVKLAFDPTENADNPPWMAAAGTMHINLDDLLTYGQAHLDEGRTETAILSVETFERLHTPVLNDYAYGWIVEERDFGDGPEPVIWHNGSNTMWYAVLYLLPERNAMITIVTNDGSAINETMGAFNRLADQIGAAIAAGG